MSGLLRSVRRVANGSIVAVGVVGALVVGASGCWQSPLTRPKEAIRYFDENNNLRQPEKATAVFAPEYMEAMRRLKKGVLRRVPNMIPGTMISVEVFGVPELSRSFYIRPDGAVDMPLVGEIEAAGKAVPDFKREVEARLRKYYKDPRVAVNVQSTQFVPQVAGGRATVIAIGGSTMVRIRGGGTSGSGGGGGGGSRVVDLAGNESLLEVIAQSGALGSELNWREVVTIRTVQDRTLIIVSNIERLLKEGAIDENIPIEDKDIVFVPTEEHTWLEEAVANIRVSAIVLGDVDSVISFFLKKR